MKKLMVFAFVVFGFIFTPLTAMATTTSSLSKHLVIHHINMSEKVFTIKVVNLKTHHRFLSMSGVTVNNIPLVVSSQNEVSYLSSATKINGKNLRLKTSYVTVGFNFIIKPHTDDITQLSGTISHLNSLKTVNINGYKVQKPNVSTSAFSDTMKIKVGQTVKLKNGKYVIYVTREEITK